MLSESGGGTACSRADVVLACAQLKSPDVQTGSFPETCPMIFQWVNDDLVSFVLSAMKCLK